MASEFARIMPEEVGCIRHVKDTGEISDSEEELFTPPGDESSSDGEYDTDLEDNHYSAQSTDHDVFGKTVYINACMNLGIIPCSKFLRQIESDEVNLRHYSLGPCGAEAIAVALMHNAKVLSLNMCDCGILEEGAIYISKMLTENCYITELDVSENKLSTQGVYAICEMLRDNTDIVDLNLSGNGLVEKDSEPIVEAMKDNYTLKSLNISHNKFRELGGQLLGPAIDANVGLEYLDLSWNHLRNKGALAVAHGLKNNCSLKSIDLSYNGFADNGSEALCEALKENTTLTDLDLTNNRIFMYGAKQIAKLVSLSSTIQVLKIGKNPFQSDGAMEILLGLQKNENSALEELYFDDIPTNAAFEDLLEQLLNSRPNLTVQCGISMRGKERVKKTKKRKDLLNLLLEYIDLRGLRMIDIFRQFDKDKSLTVTRTEFMTGLRKAGIPMTKKQLKKLCNILDSNNDGKIDYTEMVALKKTEIYDRYKTKKTAAKKETSKVKQLKAQLSKRKSVIKK